MKNLKAVIICLIFTLIVLSFSVSAQTEGRLQLFFAPQMMDDNTGDIIVDLTMRNFNVAIPDYLGSICGVTAAFEYDAEHFEIVTDDNGNAVFIVDDETLFKAKSDLEIKTNGNKISVVFLDSTLEKSLIKKDGVLCRFILRSKNPLKLWNSTDYYPIRFAQGSVGIITFNEENGYVGSYDKAEGIDGRVGGYNVTPVLVTPSVNKTISFIKDVAQIGVNGETAETDAAAYVENGVWMIPVRYLAENIGMDVEWNGESMTASAYAMYKTLKISIMKESPVVYINSAKCYLDNSPAEKDGRIYVPLEVVTRLYPGTEISAGDTELVMNFK